MRRISGRGNILRRIEALESRSVDGSGLPPHTPGWLAFWQRQVSLYETGQEHVPLTLEGVRAVMQADPGGDDLADAQDAGQCDPELAAAGSSEEMGFR